MKTLEQFIKEALCESQQIPDVMYRNNDAFGSGVVDAVKVCQYEIFELRNQDILYTALSYIKDEDMTGRINELIEQLDEDDEAEIFDDEDLQKEFIVDMLDDLGKIFGVRIKYAMWLASKKSVEDNYPGEVISAYKTSKAILSDLNGSNPDGEGILFGYEKKPQEI